ncbi:hypothetical protein LGM85_30435 [Burkholderia multivorans]|uniref:hypothetical protein n=1 Tax=Burkholderia multivorans TaxID=87883 RepID=UPI0019D1F7AB|nr:hypothetical protein [Burkholderia multivorans]MBN6738934.1 hypothetical protein [Burkholderia multivorans]MBN7130344.1 hypothetical protein [Burkholderia multivorans]MBN8173355.1 hypothetical protein [Burkholderia multivorans]MBU9372685.1 hypothetical protein [Burkholderia multivorans]MBU9440041.1 hypothetical protein [Burkholderia multivorans]
MARMKYFNGTQELHGIHGMDREAFANAFPKARGRRYDGFTMMVGYPTDGNGGPVPVERVIEFKSNPSRHACDSRCLNAQGKVMRCECACGGQNHGRGVFSGLVQSQSA